MSEQGGGRTRARFFALFTLGAVGIAFLPLIVAPMLRNSPPEMPPGIAPPPFPVVVLLALFNPLLLLALAVWVGLRCAGPLGLRSFVDDRVREGARIWPRLRPTLPMAVALGITTSVAAIALDASFAPFMGAEWRALDDSRLAAPGSPAALIAGMTYGGITEEIMMRWGFMSFVAWCVWRMRGRSGGGLTKAGMWSAIALAALTFGVAHLPAMASLVSLTPVMTARTVLLNAIGGVAFGWLFWRRGLEAAMVAHASSHVGLAIILPIVNA